MDRDRINATSFKRRPALNSAHVQTVLQPRLAIGPVDDSYEREAERVADQVMRMPAPIVQRAPMHIQRCSKCAKATRVEDMCPSCAAKAREGGLLQRDAVGAMPEVTPDIESSISAMRGGGQPLGADVRAFMEPRFGHDFGKVRVHTNARAASTAAAVNALAFTTGRDVVFGAGQYQPGTDAGKRLIAHELTHVVQQGIARKIDSGILLRQEEVITVSDTVIDADEIESTIWSLKTKGEISGGEGLVGYLGSFELENVSTRRTKDLDFFGMGIGGGLSEKIKPPKWASSKLISIATRIGRLLKWSNKIAEIIGSEASFNTTRPVGFNDFNSIPGFVISLGANIVAGGKIGLVCIDGYNLANFRVEATSGIFRGFPILNISGVDIGLGADAYIVWGFWKMTG